MKGCGITWSDKHLFLYLANPGKHIPGNKMSFAGLASEQDRANVIAYLKDN
jgi:cytochrome c